MMLKPFSKSVVSAIRLLFALLFFGVCAPCLRQDYGKLCWVWNIVNRALMIQFQGSPFGNSGSALHRLFALRRISAYPSRDCQTCRKGSARCLIRVLIFSDKVWITRAKTANEYGKPFDATDHISGRPVDGGRIYDDPVSI